MITVDRHRTALRRNFLSRPLQQAFEDGLIDSGVTVFDYGCGRGGDVRHLTQMELEAGGWDPAYAPDAPLRRSDVVNLGYVVNVIEDPAERAKALQRAWGLAKQVMIVSARLNWEAPTVNGRRHADGVITSNGTFQKFYTQEELRSWIDRTLGVRSVAAAPGIFYIFRDAGAQQGLLARSSRRDARRQAVAEIIYQQNQELLGPLEAWLQEYRLLPTPPDIPDANGIIEEFGSLRSAFALIRRATGPNQWSDVELPPYRQSERRFEQNLDLLQPLIDFLTDRGRLPRAGELPNERDLCGEFGSVRAAFSAIRRVTGPERWAEHEARARDDFLVYLALAAFGGRPKFSDLPADLQYDAKDLFGSYKAAQAHADELLFSAGDLQRVRQACNQAAVGKWTPESLYVHQSALSQLPPVLRVYEGCARTLTGTVPNATIIKLHQHKPQVSYLIYPDFDRDPHPALLGSVISRLARLHVDYRSFADSDNPPILHRKEALVSSDYPGRAKFERLTRQEERRGLLSNPNIGTSSEWRRVLAAAGVATRGHRLVRARSEG